MLTHLRSEGLKGRTIDFDIGAATVFAGPNGTGKSTAILAILAGLRGLRESQDGKGIGIYLGPAERRPGGTVELAFDAGVLVRDLSVLRGKVRIQADTRGDTLAGPHLVTWDLGDFASGSDQSRRELLSHVLSAGGSQGWEYTRCVEWISQHLSAPEEPWSIELCGRLLPARKPREEFGLWLTRVTGAAEEKQSGHREKMASAKGAVEELVAQRSEAAQVPPGRRDQVAQRLEKVAHDLGEMEPALADRKGAAKRADERKKDGEKKAKAVGAAEKALGEAETATAAARRAREAHQDRPDRRKELADAEAAARKTVEGAEKAEADLRDLRDLRKAKVDQLVGEVETLAGLLEGGQPACRHCGGADPLGIGDRLADAVERRDLLQEALSDLEMDLKLASADVRDARAALETARLAVIEEGRQARAHEEERGRLNRAVVTAQEAEERARVAMETAETDLTAWRDSLPDEEAQSLPGDLETAEALIAALKEEQGTLGKERDKLTRLEGLEAAIQTAIANRDTATTRWRKAKAWTEALRELRGAVARDAYSPLTDAANSLLLEAGIPLAVYMESESDWGARIGGVGSGPQVHWHALSDGERAACAAALAYAFAVVTKAPWQAVPLDRLEAVDADRRQGLLRALVARGVQVVAAMRADSEAECPTVEGVTVQWMGRP